MKTGLLVAALLSSSAVLTGARAEPAVYELDPDRSFVHFEVQHFATSTLRGRLGPLHGDVVLDSTAKRGELSLRIPMATLDTGIGVFTERLSQADLLDTRNHPEAFFVARQFRFDPGGISNSSNSSTINGNQLVEVRGELTLRGISQPLSLFARRFGCRAGVGDSGQIGDSNQICGGDFEGTLLRSDFGATLGLPLVADRVRLLVQVEGKRRP
jgi:polyisoprenoid-binding protein YceI